ncbi:MmgE/PrpD family protein, partial [Georgenia sp. 10Sc9-8]|nr:MmgE/PrpD family protein [Georgenia halotolerans]
VGVEVSTRIAAVMQPEHYRLWHTTGTVGTIGAAVAASALLDNDVAATVHAAATATTMAAGLQQAMRGDSMSKPLHSGHAAEAGVLAARLAAHGYRGAPDVLEGAAGLGAATADAPDWSGTFDDMDSTAHIGALTIKVHACCGHTFAAIDATLQMRKELDLDAEAVRAVEVATYGTALTVAGNPEPRTGAEAKFSIAYCVAAALTRGDVDLSAFSDESLASEPLRRLTRHVSLSVDPELDAAFPARRGARVRLHLADGRVVERTARTRRGDPEAPVSDEELRKKFEAHVAPVLGEAGCAELADRLWVLDRSSDVSELLGTAEVTA